MNPLGEGLRISLDISNYESEKGVDKNNLY